MSLSDIPQNHIRRNAQRSHSPVNHGESRLHTGILYGDENSEILRKPSSIQSMLRNTTETGDVGQFSIKPPRVTTSSPRLSPATNKTRATSSKRRHPTPYYNSHYGHNRHYGPEPPHHGSTASNGSGYQAPSHRGPTRMPSFEDYHSHSISITNRHPYANGHNPSRRDVPSVRSHSPYAYPTRLKRPGYRPSSPSLTELNKTMVGYGPAVLQDPSSRTTSPASAYNMNRTPSPFRYVVDRSDPRFQHYPPHLGTEPTRNRSPSTSSTHPSTHKPSGSPKSKASSTRVQRKKSITAGSWPHPQTSPVSPIFYDYTEEFEEQENNANSTISSKMLAEQSMHLVDSSTYSELGVSPDSTDIAELPSETSPRKMLLQQHAPAFNQSTLEIDREGDGFTQTAPQDLSDVPELPEKEMAATQAELPSNRAQHCWYEKGLHRSLPVSPSLSKAEAIQTTLPEDNDRFQPSPKECATDLRIITILRTSNQDSTSPIGSILSAKSSVLPEAQPTAPEQTHDARATSSSDFKHGTPTNNIQLEPEPVEGGEVDLLEPSRGTSFEGHSRFSTEILSPTPERSIISPNNLDRFSKLLSMGEGPLDLETLVSPASKDQRRDSPMEGNHSTYIAQTSTASPLWRINPLAIRNSPLKQHVAGNALVERSDSDSEEEPELTVALRQTFCKDEDDIDNDMMRQRTISSPISLPSQFAGRRFDPSIKLRRSPAIRRSTTGLHTPLEEPRLIYSKDYEYVEPQITCSSPATPLERSASPDKEPPRLPRKQVSLISISPAINHNSSGPPFDFIPLIHRASYDDDSNPGVGAVPSLPLEQNNLVHEEGLHETSRSEPMLYCVDNDILPIDSECENEVDQTSALNGKGQSKRNSATSPHASVASRPGSRPWNLDSSYPWNNQLPELDVVMPQSAIDSHKSAEKMPRFKLKIHRASSSTGGTSKLRKELPPLASSGMSFFSSHDLLHGPSFQRKRNPNLSVLPGQINSSHDIIQSSRQRTRFVDTFETQSPTISLQPPSPGYEVRSFFSDDSSQIRPKPSFLKRFSGYRARAAATRAASMDERRSYDRGLLSSALGRSRASGRTSRQSRATGRSSRQSQNTAGTSFRTSNTRRTRWKMIDRIRMWSHSRDGMVRDWGWRMGYRRGKNRSASTPLYTGV